MAPDSSPFPSEPKPSSPPGSDRREEMEAWRKRSRAIRFWRRALPVAIGAIAVVLVAWIGGRSLIVKLTAPPKAAPKSTGVHMTNPRFYGRDASNQAFVLGAAEAARDMSTGKSVALSAPTMTLGADSSSPTHVQADSGIYHEDQRRLTLQGQVQLKSASGYSFSTPQARAGHTIGPGIHLRTC